MAFSNSGPVSAFPAVTIENRSTPSLSFILQALIISSSGRKSYTSQLVWLCADWAQYLQSSGQRPLRPFMIEHKSTLSPILAARILSAPSHNSFKSQVRKKDKSSSRVMRRPSIISCASVSASMVCLLCICVNFTVLYDKQKLTECQPEIRYELTIRETGETTMDDRCMKKIAGRKLPGYDCRNSGNWYNEK